MVWKAWFIVISATISLRPALRLRSGRSALKSVHRTDLPGLRPVAPLRRVIDLHQGHGEDQGLVRRDRIARAIAAIAKLLKVSDRSLRRQLTEQGVSFRSLLDELRMQIAMKYLRTTKLANEDIALALGFSDAANFRRAFRRWTNKSPSEIRGEQVKSL